MAYDCLKRLYKEELYSNVAYLVILIGLFLDGNFLIGKSFREIY